MTVQKAGRICFSLAISALGVSNLFVLDFQSARFFDSGIAILYILIGFVFWTGLVVVSLGIVFSKRPQIAAAWMAWMISSWIMLRHVPLLISDFANPAQWNFAAMALATCGGAFIMAGSFYDNTSTNRKVALRSHPYILVGKMLLGLSVLVLGSQHILYAEFIISMIPLWIPGKIAAAWLTGILMMVIGISFLCSIKIGWSSFALGTMTLSWIPLLHFSRIVAQPEDVYEWIYALQAMLVGTSAIVLSHLQQKSASANNNVKVIFPEIERSVADCKREIPDIEMHRRGSHPGKYPTSRGSKLASYRSQI
jgi:uncharacterized membrane protein